MTHILRVDATIKTDGSVSRRLTDRIVNRLEAANPGATVTTRDLAEGEAVGDLMPGALAGKLQRMGLI